MGVQVWEKYSPEADTPAETNGAAEPATSREPRPVVVTEVQDASSFFVQFADEPRVNWIEEQLRGLSLEEGSSSMVGGCGGGGDRSACICHVPGLVLCDQSDLKALSAN